MAITAINHLAFITNDMTKTIRFYRDLLDLKLSTGIGHGGSRQYFFRFGDCQIAFISYEGAVRMQPKFPGVKTTEPLGFDHLALTVGTCQELFSFKDRLTAAGFSVHGAVDHGYTWSIYFYDPNNIPLELSWDCMQITEVGAVIDDDPLEIVNEGGSPQPGHWPDVKNSTPASEWRAKPGDGRPLRDTLIENGCARLAINARLEKGEIIPLID